MDFGVECGKCKNRDTNFSKKSKKSGDFWEIQLSGGLDLLYRIHPDLENDITFKALQIGVFAFDATAFE
jgi:hypothetical protein